VLTIRDGRIVAIADQARQPDAVRLLDATGAPVV
jgi:hypothetical protein